MALTTSPGLTLDTGALIALERGEKRMRTVMQRADQRGLLVTVPAVVLGEWWRGGTGRQRSVLELIDVEPGLLADLLWKTMKDNCMAQNASSGCCTP